MNFTLHKAPKELFARYFATYYPNIWFRPSWEELKRVAVGAQDGYWIRLGETIAGGVIVREGSLSCLFALPSFQADIAELLKPIIGMFASGGRLDAYCVLDHQVEAFLHCGFEMTETRSCMIRPTEHKDIVLPDGYTIRPPESKDASLLTALIYESYLGGVDQKSFEETSESVRGYFANNIDELLWKASAILYDYHSTAVGGCLVSMWEGMPLIYDLAIMPEKRGKGLGICMLHNAIHRLYDKHRLLRLFVTAGNSAELLYTKLSFLSGGNYSTLRLVQTK